jgi:hypothetical protein
MACRSESTFDRLARAVASEVSRRQVFRYMGATALGATLTTLGMRKAEAADRFCADGCPGCPQGVSCRQHRNGTFCYCFQLAKNPFICKCKGDFFCSQALPCNRNADCVAALGRGAKCLTASCCGTFRHCAPKCGNGIAAGAQGGATGAGA